MFYYISTMFIIILQLMNTNYFISVIHCSSFANFLSSILIVTILFNYCNFKFNLAYKSLIFIYNLTNIYSKFKIKILVKFV